MPDREPTFGAMTFVVQMEQDKERLLPKVSDFVQGVDDFKLHPGSRTLRPSHRDLGASHQSIMDETQRAIIAVDDSTRIRTLAKPTRQVVC